MKKRISRFVEATLKNSTEAMPLATLGNLVSAEFDDIQSGDWLGYGALRPLIEDLGIRTLTIDPIPPGYVFLHGVHKSPPTPSTRVWQEAGIEEVEDSELKGTLLEAQRMIDLPTIGEEGYRVVLETLSAEVQESEFSLSEVSKAVRDEVKARGKAVARSAVSYVIKRIGSSGHAYDPDLPQDPVTLARAFWTAVDRNLRRQGVMLETSARRALHQYVTGGLVTPQFGPPESPSGLDRDSIEVVPPHFVDLYNESLEAERPENTTPESKYSDEDN